MPRHPELADKMQKAGVKPGELAEFLGITTMTLLRYKPPDPVDNKHDRVQRALDSWLAGETFLERLPGDAGLMWRPATGGDAGRKFQEAVDALNAYRVAVMAEVELKRQELAKLEAAAAAVRAALAGASRARERTERAGESSDTDRSCDSGSDFTAAAREVREEQAGGGAPQPEIDKGEDESAISGIAHPGGTAHAPLMTALTLLQSAVTARMPGGLTNTTVKIPQWMKQAVRQYAKAHGLKDSDVFVGAVAAVLPSGVEPEEVRAE